MALVVIVHCERMFYTELRKALHFPQRKKRRSKQNKYEVEKEDDEVKKKKKRGASE